jgi:hypothetical protein
MRAIRRILQIVAFVGTLMVGIVALSLIVSQTPWFKDWLRRFIVRESKQYVNGELAIGGLSGNLLFGVDLTNVAVDVSGQRVVAVKALELDYSVFELMSRGLVLNRIKIDQPALQVERDANGWNLARLVKRQAQEADRQGPMRPISLPSIEISDATVTIQDRTAGGAFTLPRRLDDLDVKIGFEYAPVHYTINLDHISFRGSSPELLMKELTGKLAVREDNLYLQDVVVKTNETSMTVNGVIEKYLSARILKLTTTGHLSMPELGRIIPAAGGYDQHPDLTVQVNGPLQRLGMDLDVKSEIGNVRGKVMTDLQVPDFAVSGDVDMERLNVGPILKMPAQRTDLTGHAKVDIVFKSQPAGTPAFDRIRGTYAFSGPRAVALGYEARNVKVTGALDKARITLDGRGAAYGATATARGFIVTPAPGRPLAFDLRGKADNVDLRRLPPQTLAPQLATQLSIADYHVSGDGPSIQGTAALHKSTVEGATLADGTTGEFALTAGAVSYGARGNVTDLDLDRIGGALNVAALAKPAYDSRLTGSFDVTGSVPRTPARTRTSRGSAQTAPSAIATMTLDASGRLTDSEFFGGRLPDLGYEAHLNQGALTGRADGRFEGFNPAQILGREALDGAVTGTVNANFAIKDVTAPITPDAVTADGKATLAGSTIGGLRIDSADVEGRYAAQVGEFTKLNVTGPDIKLDASGRLALDRTSDSNVKYHVDAINLPELAKLAGQTGVGGTAVLDGTLTGNAATLKTTGTLDGSNLSYQDNSALDLNSQYAVTVPELDFARAHVQATTDATFVSVAGTQLNSVKATTTYDQQRIDFTTTITQKTRVLDATGEVILHPDHQEIHLPQLSLKTQGVEWHTAPGSLATVQYRGGGVELKDVRLISGDQSLDLSGTLPSATQPSAGAIDVHARNVDIQQLETLMLQNRGFAGKLTADAKISGTTAAPKIDGHVEIRQGAFKTYHYDSLVAEIDYGGTRVGIDATLQQSPTEAITAKGSVPTSLFQPGTGGGHVEPAAGQGIDLQIKSTPISLGLIQGMTNQVTNVTGTLQVDVHVMGTGQDPHFNGFIDISNGSFGLPMVGETFTGLTTRVDLEPDRVRIQKFELLDRHQERLTITGELAVHEGQVGSVNVSVDSDNFEVVHNQLGDVQVESRLKITGELRKPRIVGDVRLDAARAEVDQILELFYDPYAVEALPDVVSAERTVEGSGSAEEATKSALARAQQSAGAPVAETAPAEPAAPSGSLFDVVALDVHLIVPDNLVLRGKNLRPGGPNGTALGNINVTVGGDLQIRKDPGGPVLPVGTVTTVRGTYEFQGRRFELARGGTIRLIGTPRIDPLLDVTATRIIPNTGVEARVRITGSLSQPELTLSSNPPLEESDILALIVFNRPVNELGTGERSSLAATAGGIATGFLAAPLGDSIGKALDLDLFEITTTTDSGDLGAGVTLGQQLGDRAFIKLRQQFGQHSFTQFQLEYQLARFLRLQTTAAPETSGSANRVNQRRVERAGIDLIFFFSY